MNNLEKSPQESLLVVIDPQKGFVDEDGSFAKAFGTEELIKIQEAIAKTGKFIAEMPNGVRVMFVRSEYQINQFAEEGPLSELCVSGLNHDCEWSDRISIPPNTKIITKEDNDACETREFVDAISNSVREDVSRVIIAGCTTTSCVKETALSIKELFPELDVIVSMDLVGARSLHYKSTKQEDKTLANIEGDNEEDLEYFGEDSSNVAAILDEFWTKGISIGTSNKIKFSK